MKNLKLNTKAAIVVYTMLAVRFSSTGQKQLL